LQKRRYLNLIVVGLRPGASIAAKPLAVRPRPVQSA
jgi:hypothetical protein